jgi:hypothetical protein
MRARQAFASLHGPQVQQRASSQWRRMPSESEPSSRSGRTFWQLRAESEAKARHAALESEWERRNPVPSATAAAGAAPRVARPLQPKRRVFELQRGAVGLRPDRVAKQVRERARIRVCTSLQDSAIESAPCNNVLIVKE